MFVAQVVVTFRQHPMRLGHKSSHPTCIMASMAFGPRPPGRSSMETLLTAGSISPLVLRTSHGIPWHPVSRLPLRLEVVALLFSLHVVYPMQADNGWKTSTSTRFSDSLKGEMARVQWQISTGNIIFLRRSLPGEATRHVFYRVILLCRCTWCEGTTSSVTWVKIWASSASCGCLRCCQKPNIQIVGLLDCPSFMHVSLCVYICVCTTLHMRCMIIRTYVHTYIYIYW